MEKKTVEVNITKGGPIHVKGLFTFKDSSGHTETKEQISICAVVEVHRISHSVTEHIVRSE